MIENIKLIHINLPLNKAYNLSYNKINYFDVYYCVVFDGKNFGIGEVTPLEGYFDTETNDIWGHNTQALSSIVGTDSRDALFIVKKFASKDKFLYSAIITALENIIYKIENGNEKSSIFKLSLIGTLMSDDINDIQAAINQLVVDKYSVIKVKAGKNIEKDIIRIKNILNILPEYVKIRIDANQGYSFAEAKKFIISIPSDKAGKIELFEQPLKIKEWINMSKLNEFAKFPLMLDESIRGEEDIVRAVSLKCCSFIKLKLMKQGSFEEIKRIFNIAKDNGLSVIIGNGVQSEIGCINEAYIIHKLKVNKFASENNGFLKQSKIFLGKNIKKDNNGKFIFDSNFDFDIFYNEIKPFIIRERNF